MATGSAVAIGDLPATATSTVDLTVSGFGTPDAALFFVSQAGRSFEGCCMRLDLFTLLLTTLRHNPGVSAPRIRWQSGGIRPSTKSYLYDNLFFDYIFRLPTSDRKNIFFDQMSTACQCRVFVTGMMTTIRMPNCLQIRSMRLDLFTLLSTTVKNN